MDSNDIAYLNSNYPEYIEQAEKNYKRNFLLLVLDSATFTFATAMFSKDTILPYFVSLLTSSPILIGLVPAVYFFGYYAPQLLGAYMANHRSRRKPMILGIVIAERLGILMIALTAQLFGQISTSWILVLFILSFMVFSFLNGLIGPAYSDFVGKSMIRTRGFFFGVSYAASGAMGLVASLISKYFLDQFPNPVNFQIVFWLGFAFSFLSPFFVAQLREVELPFISQPEPLRNFLHQIPSQLNASPLFVRYISARAILGLGLMGNSFYTIYAIQQFSLSEGSLGVFTLIILLAQSILSLVWGWVGDRFGYKIVLLVSAICLALQAFLALVASAPWVFFIIAFMIGGIYSALWISDPNYVYEIVTPDQTSKFLGIANTLIAPISVLGPLLAGILVGKGGYTGLFLVTLVISAFSILGVWILVKEPRGRSKLP